MPYLYGAKSQQAKLIGRLEQEYLKVAKANGIPLGDFPPIDDFKRGMQGFDVSEFTKLSQRQLDVLDKGLTKDIPVLVQSLQESAGVAVHPSGGRSDPTAANPFESTVDFASGEAWVVDATNKAKWDNLFRKLGAKGQPAVLDGASVRPVMMESGLPQSALRRVWDLSDCDKDGLLDAEEFALAMHLVSSARISGVDSIPTTLPPSFIPPTKR
mmetsp:Transcript_14280/g.35380  ORF Transcript_14280/g.35380 Transcript_14280/m.35380 type:complete len:213 (-) Transcript_14280:6-644(-)